MAKDLHSNHPSDRGIWVNPGKPRMTVQQRADTLGYVCSPEQRAAMEAEDAAINSGFKQIERHGGKV